MARAARYYRQTEIELVERAKKKLKRNPETNAFNDAELIAAVESEMEFDPVRERRVKAERIVRSQERPRNTEPDGSAWLPGFEPVPYEPNRLMRDDEGNTVERDLATPHFISAALVRANDNLQKQIKAFKRTLAESDEYAAWAADQAIMGRPPNEITFGNFLREKGYWRPDAVDPVDDELEVVDHATT